jgi:hypothetical protein
MGSLNILSALAMVVVCGSAMAATPVTNTMMDSQARSLFSQEGIQAMEKARLECLSKDQEAAFKDPRTLNSGVFKIRSRYKHSQTQQRCREYVVNFMGKDGQNVPRNDRRGPLAFKQVACLNGQQWEKYEGDKAMLVGEAGTPAQAAAQAPSGLTGPEHRRQYPNMIGPKVMGDILDQIKDYKIAILNDKTEDGKEGLRKEMYTWINTLAGEMKTAQKTMALDQLVIMLGQIEGDSAKIKVAEGIKSRLVRIGDAAKKKEDVENITKLIRDAAKKSELERSLNQVPESLDALTS